MAHRPLNKKRADKLRRLMMHGSRPEPMIDLVQWLKDRGHAQTTGQAERLILDGRVRSESHPLGRMHTPTLSDPDKHIVMRLVSASVRDTIEVVSA